MRCFSECIIIGSRCASHINATKGFSFSFIPKTPSSSLSKSLASNSEYTKFNTPASICERSKISFTSRNNRSLFSEIISVYIFFSSSLVAVAIRPENPTIAFNGVRTSWLILAIKADLSLSAEIAFSLSTSNNRCIFRSSVTS